MSIDLPKSPRGARLGDRPAPCGYCYFCEVIAGREEKGIVEETDATLTLVNWNQFELGQVYVIPRRHAATLFDLTDEEAAAVMRAIRRVAEAQMRAYDPDGLNLIQNNGVSAGQSVPHFHVHVVPRRKADSNWGNGPPHIAEIEGKQPLEPARPYRITTQREHEIAAQIRQRMGG